MIVYDVCRVIREKVPDAAQGQRELDMRLVYSETPLNRPPLGPVKLSLLEGWPQFRGEFVLKSMLWGFSKRCGHISGS